MSESANYLIRIITVFVLALPANSGFAEERVLPPLTVVKSPNGETLTLRETHFLITRVSLDKANATAQVNRELSASLKRCAEEKRKLSKQDDPKWVTALKWSAVGLGIGLAFTAGTLAAR